MNATPGRIMRSHFIALIAIAAAACAGCASNTPVAEVRLVSKAFQDLNAASAPLLDDLAVAERAQGQVAAGVRARKHGAGTASNAAVEDRCAHVTQVSVGSVSVQNGFCIEDSYYYSDLADPPATATFRRSLAAVESYTNVLLILAEGRNVEAAQAEVQSLAGNVGGVLDLAGASGVGVALQGFASALQPLLEIAAKRANAKELARSVKEISPKAVAVADQLRIAAPELFTTLTERPLARLRTVGLTNAEVAAAERARIEGYRSAVSNYVVLLDQYKQLLERLVQSYDTEGRSITLSGLVQKSTELSAQADAWRRTYSALRTGF
jgi:hypothetical protein